MGIGFTNTEPFKAVSLQDTALLDLELDTVRRYELSRDINDLPMDELNAKPDKPTVFTIKPLTVKYENVTVPFVDMHSARAIFKEHVIDISNVDHRQKAKGKDGKLTDEACESIPMNIVVEIATLIIQAQHIVPGGKVPFSLTLSDTFSQRKTDLRRKTLLAQLQESAVSEDVKISE